MMTNPMTCELFEERLMAYLEQETDDVTRLAMDRHAVTCDNCGTLLADLRKLRFDAANLPAMEPSRDLWSGIAARIEAPVVPIGQHVASRPARREWTRVALLAASLVLAAGIGYFAAVRRTTVQTARVSPAADTQLRVALAPDTSARTVDTTGSATPAPTTALASATTRERAPSAAVARPVRLTGAQSVHVAYTNLTADYDREIARLHVLIEQRRNQLDPVTVAIIEKNLAVIDTAIAQCRMAIARDPASRFLLESLNQSLQTKVDLMRTAALLPSRT
jgi:Putative zinc-finger